MSTHATPDLYGFEEFLERHLQDLTPEQRLKGLAPEQRLQGLAPEQRLQGLAPEQRLQGLSPEQRLQGLSEAEQVLALPPHLLRALSDDYIATLPADVQAIVYARVEPQDAESTAEKGHDRRAAESLPNACGLPDRRQL